MAGSAQRVRRHVDANRMTIGIHPRAHQGRACSRQGRGKKLGGKRSNALSASCTVQGVAALKQRATSAQRHSIISAGRFAKLPCLVKKLSCSVIPPPRSFENKSGFRFRKVKYLL